MQRVHGRRRHRQTGQADAAAHSDAQILVVSVVQAHTDAHSDVHGVRVTFGQVGHDVGRIINFVWHVKNDSKVQRFTRPDVRIPSDVVHFTRLQLHF